MATSGFPMNRWLAFLALALLAPMLVFAGEPPKHFDNPYAVVASAGMFAIGGVGYAGRTTDAETCLRQIVKQKDGEELCRKLLQEKSPVAQLYGLFGLKILDGKAFAEAYPKFEKSKVKVRTASGCEVYEGHGRCPSWRRRSRDGKPGKQRRAAPEMVGGAAPRVPFFGDLVCCRRLLSNSGNPAERLPYPGGMRWRSGRTRRAKKRRPCGRPSFLMMSNLSPCRALAGAAANDADSPYFRSKRSRFITLVQAATKSLTNFFLRVRTRVDFREGAEHGVGAEDEVRAGGGPLGSAGLAVHAREGVAARRDLLPLRAHVEQVHEEVVGQRLRTAR